jgi:hypothetical protein
MIRHLRQNREMFSEMCSNPLTDEKLMQKFKFIKFDLAVVNTFFTTGCLAIIPYRLDIPFVSFNIVYEPWVMRSPSLPSFVPFFNPLPPFTEKMTFVQFDKHVGPNTMDTMATDLLYRGWFYCTICPR